MRLKGKRLDHWGEGLAARYDEAREDDWKADLRRRVEHLDGLPDDVFADLPAWLVRQSIDAHQGFGSHGEWADSLSPYIPDPVPVPDLSGCLFPTFGNTADDLPLLLFRNPMEHLCVSQGGEIDTWLSMVARRAVADSMGLHPTFGWRADREQRNVPLYQLGWWPADGGQPLLMAWYGSGGGNEISIAFQSWSIPAPAPGWVRARILQWAASARRVDETGEWSDPVYVDRLFLREKLREAVSPTRHEDVPAHERFQRRVGRGTRSYVPAAPGTLRAIIPIEAAGANPPRHTPDPKPFDSDWRLPPRPDAKAAPAAHVSDEARAWLRARAKRYSKSRTGRFWRELAEALK